MPPMHAAASGSEPKNTNRTSSVPLSPREISEPVLLRSEKSEISFLDVGRLPPSSLPTIVNTRGRACDSSFCTTSQADCMAEPVEASEQRPQKRRKRSSSTPTAPRLSQLSTRSQSRRRSRSRVGSPTADAEYIRPSRISARLAHKIHPFISSRSSDIYLHLADPDGAGNLLSEPPAGSVMSSTSNEIVGLQSAKQPRGRRRKVVDLIDENAKKHFMEEAQMRQSQGILPLSGIDENACFSQMLLRDSRKGDESVSSMRLEVITRRNSPDAGLVRNEATTISNIPQSQEATLDVSPRDFFSTQADFESTLPAGTDTPGKQLGHKGSVLPSDSGNERLTVSGVPVEAPSTSIPDSHLGEASLGGELASVPEAAYHIDLPQCSGTSQSTPSALPSREDSVQIRHTKSINSPNGQVEGVGLNNPSKDSHTVTFSQAPSFDNNNIQLDSDQGFYMLDIPEIFTLPWVPVTSHLYVPPSLGKLVSGMREQLMIEARARRRAEELYQAELSQRISAEEIIADLRTKLEERQKMAE